jgi:hypothetical protein
MRQRWSLLRRYFLTFWVGILSAAPSVQACAKAHVRGGRSGYQQRNAPEPTLGFTPEKSAKERKVAEDWDLIFDHLNRRVVRKRQQHRLARLHALLEVALADRWLHPPLPGLLEAFFANDFRLDHQIDRP